MPSLTIRPTQAMTDLIAGRIDEDQYYEQIVELCRSEMEAELASVRAVVDNKKKSPGNGKRHKG